jgi:hypothetical protein
VPISSILSRYIKFVLSRTSSSYYLVVGIVQRSEHTLTIAGEENHATTVDPIDSERAGRYHVAALTLCFACEPQLLSILLTHAQLQRTPLVTRLLRNAQGE